MSLSEIFSSAGQQPGLEIWRVENFELVPVESKFHGQFFTGDCYVVLFTKIDDDGVKSQNLHMLRGEESTQDEYATRVGHI